MVEKDTFVTILRDLTMLRVVFYTALMNDEFITLVDKSAIVVRPKQAYIDWANHFNDGGPTLSIEDARRDPDVFLIDELEDDFEHEPQKKKILREYYTTIFEHQLDSWMTDEGSWPQKRDFQTFLDWFDVEICSMVLNISKDLVQEEPY
jgi:hypothetical protein